MLRKNAVEIVKNMQRLRDDRDRAEAHEGGEDRLARRRTIQNLVNQQQKRQPIGTLDVAFRKRFQQLSSQTAEGRWLGQWGGSWQKICISAHFDWQIN